MNKPIRVLQMTGSLGYAGIETMIMNVYRNIDRDQVQFDFVVCSDEGRFVDEVRERGGRIFVLPSRSRHPIKYHRALYKLLKENGEYDIFHCNTNSASAYVDLLAAKRAKVATRILHSHNASCIVKWQHYIFKPLLKSVYTDKFACSYAASEWMFGNRGNVSIINNGIDLTRFGFSIDRRDRIRSAMNADEKFVIGHVGSFQIRKNQRFLIDVFDKLDITDKELWLIGDGETKSDLVTYASQSESCDKIKFLGNRNDVEELMQGMDIFAFPSLFEGLAVVAIEAQAAGLKCVISDTVTDECMITDNIVRLPLNNIERWIDAIKNYANYDRKSVDESIRSAGYDVRETALWLQKFYLNKISGIAKNK